MQAAIKESKSLLEVRAAKEVLSARHFSMSQAEVDALTRKAADEATKKIEALRLKKKTG